MIDSVELQNLQEKANNIRKNILDVVYNAASGHPGGSLSIADVLSVLYFKELNVDINNPKNENRDSIETTNILKMLNEKYLVKENNVFITVK